MKGYDYSQPGVYFVTICSWNRECLFGDIVDGEMQLNEYGMVVDKFINKISDRFINTELDCSIIMPNHVHAIIAPTTRTCLGIPETATNHVIAENDWLVQNEFVEINQSNAQPSRYACLAT